MRAFGWYSATRRTTSAAVTSALSVRNGHRAVARRAADHEPAPVDALLAHRHLQLHAGLGGDRHAAALGDDVVRLHRVELLARRDTSRRRCRRPPRRPPPGRSACRAGVKPLLASRRVATAIVDVRFSMSMAPRPQTTPSTSSPPKGSRCQPDGIDGHDVGVAHEQERGRLRVAALDARDEAHAAGPRRCSARSGGPSPRSSPRAHRSCGPRGRRRRVPSLTQALRMRVRSSSVASVSRD